MPTDVADKTALLEPARSRDRAELIACLARWCLGALFIYMGLNKALHPVDFLKLVRQYDLVSIHYLLNAIAAGLPWFEVFCGVLLVAGVAVRGTAVMVMLMLVPFTLLVLNRALAISSLQGLAFCAVEFDCGCGAGVVNICHKLVENCAIVLVSIWIAFTGKGRFLALWFGLK